MLNYMSKTVNNFSSEGARDVGRVRKNVPCLSSLVPINPVEFAKQVFRMGKAQKLKLRNIS